MVRSVDEAGVVFVVVTRALPAAAVLARQCKLCCQDCTRCCVYTLLACASLSAAHKHTTPASHGHVTAAACTTTYRRVWLRGSHSSGRSHALAARSVANTESTTTTMSGVAAPACHGASVQEGKECDACHERHTRSVYHGEWAATARAPSPAPSCCFRYCAAGNPGRCAPGVHNIISANNQQDRTHRHANSMPRARTHPVTCMQQPVQHRCCRC